MRVLRTYEESRFWKALEDCGAGRRPCANAQAVRELKAAVGAVAGRAKEIGKEICRYLPQYTLHDETHLLNVLSIMDALVPDALMARLTPLECGLCLLAAYTHDLGMALSAEEHQALAGEEDTPERRRYQAFRDGYGEELRQVERWLKTGTAEGGRRAELIEGYLLATYLRETHTDADSGRIERWLRAVMADTRNEGLYRYNGFHYLQNLVDIAASHGQSVSWLRQRLAPEGDGAFDRLVGAGERANLAFPGLLLRLADILDFDASRAPGILFRHIGIENERSILEWNKHLAIRGWELVREERPTLSYEAECAHPAYEKAIRDFVRSIDEELRAVADEALRQNDRVFKHRRHFDLDLPARVDLQVFPEGHPHRPAYVYREMQFRLDQDEIRQLLLGQSLWGDPQLCIRELLQNALDAVQMRDLRLKAKAKGEQALGPADPLPAGEELRVELSWGRDKTCDQEYIVVRDNGIGMTREVLERYFTQIGKSYYRSPDYKRERAALNAHGLLATPISFFGIGILSCFMIADRLEVRTHPGGRNPEATDVTISGPGSLFWLKTGTRAHQGTEVKLFLKREYHLVDVPDMLLHRLNMHFYRAPGESGVALAQDPHGVDPAFATGTHVLWPLFPVLVGPEGGQVLRIDGDFHKDVLFPIDRQKVVKKAGEWGCPESWVGDAEWGTWDWTDDVGPEATGSRLRLRYCWPASGGPAGGFAVLSVGRTRRLCGDAVVREGAPESRRAWHVRRPRGHLPQRGTRRAGGRGPRVGGLARGCRAATQR